MQQYLDLLRQVLTSGTQKKDRTNTGTVSSFGTQTRYNLVDEFPIVTTKKVNFKAIVTELLWIINGDTNIKFLVDNNVNIWNDWPFEKYAKSNEYQNETKKEFVQKIKEDTDFANKWGELGPVYGKQWRSFEGIDQLKQLINDLKNNSSSRRLIISAWNPKRIDEMLLPPCHCFMQFYVSENKQLSCQLYQRSADLFLGVPFNISSYSLLTYLLAYECGLKPYEFIHTIGDAHIYMNHLDQVKLQLARIPHKVPKLLLKNGVKSIFDYEIEDIDLDNYTHDSIIKAVVAV